MGGCSPSRNRTHFRRERRYRASWCTILLRTWTSQLFPWPSKSRVIKIRVFWRELEQIPHWNLWLKDKKKSSKPLSNFRSIFLKLNFFVKAYRLFRLSEANEEKKRGMEDWEVKGDKKDSFVEFTYELNKLNPSPTSQTKKKNTKKKRSIHFQNKIKRSKIKPTCCNSFVNEVFCFYFQPSVYFTIIPFLNSTSVQQLLW